MTKASPSDARIEQFDGLRALSFLVVLGYHAVSLPLGWAGVDQFFVLSGFLITKNLLDLRERATTKSALAVFFYRRVLRILPPYYLALAVMAVFSPALVRALPWYLAFASNVHDTMPTMVHGPPLTMWSIAVEEQFYLAWPWLVLLMPRRYLTAAFVAVAAAAPLCRALVTHLGVDAVVRLTPCRMDVLAFGALLAVADRRDATWLERHRRLAFVVAALAGGGFLAFRVAAGQYGLDYSSLPCNVAGMSLSALFFASMLWIVRTLRAGPARALLMWGPLRYLGRISYMAYLIHDVFIEQMRPLGLKGRVSLPLALVATIAFASVTWYALEQPLLRLRHLVAPKPRQA